MSKVKLTRGMNSMVSELHTSRTWGIPLRAEIGTATIKIPYTHPFFTERYINPDGGNLITIFDEDKCGIWEGIGLPYTYTSEGLEVQANHYGFMMAKQALTAIDFKNAPDVWIADTIIQSAIENFLPGFVYPTANHDGSGGRLIREFTLDRRTPWDALQDLTEQAPGSEFILDYDNKEIYWGRPATANPTYPELLVAGSDIINWVFAKDWTEVVSEVIQLDGNASYMERQSHPENVGWNTKIVVTGLTQAGASPGEEARQALLQYREPAVTVSGTLIPKHRKIRERQFVRILLPVGDIHGLIVQARVISRTVTDDNPNIMVEFDFIPEIIDNLPVLTTYHHSDSGGSGSGSPNHPRVRGWPWQTRRSLAFRLRDIQKRLIWLEEQ